MNAQTIRETIAAVLSDVSKDDGKTGWCLLKYYRDDEDVVGFVNPYEGEKGAILLETRMFNETPLNPIKCFDCLTKVLNLLITKVGPLTCQ